MYASWFFEIGESHYIRSDEKSSDNVLYQNDLSDPKIEKMKFNPHWQEKYILVTVLREVCCSDMLTVCQK